MAFKKDKRLTLGISENESNLINSSSRLSGLRGTFQRTRTSIAPQYMIDVNSTENCNETQVDEEDQNEVLLGYLIAPLWNICRVSPLNNLDYSATKLKQYALKLRQFIAANSRSDSSHKFKTDIRIVKNLKLEINHPDAIEITVSTSMKNSENQFKNVYSGILFSWGYFAARSEPGVTHLPLLLDRGHGKISTSVRQILSKLFDCVITPLCFNQTELLLFTASLSSFISNTNQMKLVNFIYNVPSTRTPTQLNISMSAEDIHNMWLSCFATENEPTVHNECTSQKLFSVFQKYIFAVYEIDISHLEIVHLKYPTVSIQSNGKIQLKDIEAAKWVLRILCEMSVILKGSIPKLASNYD